MGTGSVVVPQGSQRLVTDAKWYAEPKNRHHAVPTEFIKQVLVASDWAEKDDEVVAVDCRDFHDPDRHRHAGNAGSAAYAEINHLGYHHSVTQGLTKNGARVWRQYLHRKEEVPFKDWVSEFVLAPFWNAAMKCRPGRSEAGSAARPKKIVLVFFCKWGRHRSVALQTSFLNAMPIIPWLELKTASHLAARSWTWSTCNFCAVWALDFNSQHLVFKF